MNQGKHDTSIVVYVSKSSQVLKSLQNNALVNNEARQILAYAHCRVNPFPNRMPVASPDTDTRRCEGRIWFFTIIFYLHFQVLFNILMSGISVKKHG